MLQSFKEFAVSHQRSHLILDSSVIFDFLFVDPATVNEIKRLSSDNSIVLAGTPAVRLEVLKNSKSEAVYLKKKSFYHDLVQAELPIDPPLVEAAHELAFAYGPLSAGASFTDLLLAASMKRYSSGSTFLMTENHKDFPVEILNRVCGFTLEVGKDLRPVAVYGFSAEKFAEAVKRQSSS